jgi:hypothetical protein
MRAIADDDDDAGRCCCRRVSSGCFGLLQVTFGNYDSLISGNEQNPIHRRLLTQTPAVLCPRPPSARAKL